MMIENNTIINNLSNFRHTGPLVLHSVENAMILEEADIRSPQFTISIPKLTPFMDNTKKIDKSITIPSICISNEMKSSGTVNIKNYLIAKNNTVVARASHFAPTASWDTSDSETELFDLLPKPVNCNFTGSPHMICAKPHKHDIKKGFKITKLDMQDLNQEVVKTITKNAWVIVNIISGDIKDIIVTDFRLGIPYKG